MSSHNALVDVDWLKKHQHDSKLVILDASVPPVVPGFTPVNAEGDFQCIPGARRFDYDKDICDPQASLPHMMPSADFFSDKVQQLGVNNDSIVVVYDDVGIYASPRAWWMFKAMGHSQVYVLDGGLPAWLKLGGDVGTALSTDFEQGNFRAAAQSQAFCDSHVVLENLNNDSVTLLDARSEGRFKGITAEPRPGLRGGHMPNAKNLPFPSLLENGHLKPETELSALLTAYANKDQRIISSCGTGLTACIITLAAFVAGYENLTVYDGSWVEWGAPGELPVVTAPQSND